MILPDPRPRGMTLRRPYRCDNAGRASQVRADRSVPVVRAICARAAAVPVSPITKHADACRMWHHSRPMPVTSVCILTRRA
jgi:hypothetical protein